MEDKTYQKPVLTGRPVDSVRKLEKAKGNPGIKVNSKNQVILQRKLNIFIEEFIKNGGKSVDAVMAMGGHTSRVAASATARKYMQELQDLGRIYMESKGVGYGKFLDHALEKMEGSKDPEWFDRLMKLTGYHDFLSKGGGNQNNNVTIIQTQDALRSEFGFNEDEPVIEAEEVKDVEKIS
jgi:hypothetical protein